MAINKDRIRQKLLNIKNGTGDNSYWSPPKEGKGVVRLIPYPHGEDPFLEYYFHFNIGRSSILCPVKNGLGHSCPICDLAATLYNSNDPADKEANKKLYARRRFYGVVIDRADETMTPKYWGFSQTNYIKFLSWLEEDGGDYENFLDFQNGLDLVVSLEKTLGKSFAAAQVEPKRRESPLGTKQEIDQILKSVKPASELFTAMSPEDIQKKLEEWANASQENVQADTSDEQQNADSEGTVKGGKEDKPKDKKKRFSAQSVDDAFDQIDNEIQ